MQVSAINNINAMLAQATSSIRNENESLLAGLNGTRTEELKRHQMQILEQVETPQPRSPIPYQTWNQV